MSKAELKNAIEYFEKSMDELQSVMARVQDAWWLVEERYDDDNTPTYCEKYPFAKDFGAVMMDVYKWHESCKEENAVMLKERSE